MYECWFDLVLFDIEMLGMNGFDVCSFMKMDMVLWMILVVIMIGWLVVGILGWVWVVGVVDFFLKFFE